MKTGSQRRLRALGACLPLLFVADIRAQQAPASATTKDQSKRELSSTEQVATWKGEKVVVKDEGFQTGVVMKVGANTNSPYEVQVQLDGTGKTITRNGFHLGFLVEFEEAKKLTGRKVWAKGRVVLSDATNPRVPRLLEVNPGTELEIERAEWSPYFFPEILLYTKLPSGEIGEFEVGSSGVAPKGWLDSRFHPSPQRTWPVNEDLFFEDPRKLYPKWNKDIWKLIESGMVAIGMTQDMVQAACGSGLKWVGAVIEGSVALMYECHDKRFLMDSGKVTKYVEKQ